MTMDPAPIPPLAGPATGSANPAASLTSLWSYIQPATDHLMRTPTHTGKVPVLAVDYHMGIHTALYNYFTTFAAARGPAPAGADFYELLDGYFGDVARDILLGMPDDDRLVHYLLPCFQRYAAGAGAVSRLLNYTNRQYVKRAIDVRIHYPLPPTVRVRRPRHGEGRRPRQCARSSHDRCSAHRGEQSLRAISPLLRLVPSYHVHPRVPAHLLCPCHHIAQQGAARPLAFRILRCFSLPYLSCARRTTPNAS
jgi:hypothetical protein